MASGKDSDRYIFLVYLRAAAAWLVVWDHLTTIIPGWANKVYAPAEWVRHNVTGPLGIALRQGDLKGELKWEEIRGMKLPRNKPLSLQLADDGA